MSFNSIPKVDKPSFYLDIAFRAARKRASIKKSSLKTNKFLKEKTANIEKVDTVRKVLTTKLNSITKSFPNIDGLNDFYFGLVNATIDYKELKKSLGAINWAGKKISELTSLYRLKIKRCDDRAIMNKDIKNYYGRLSSVFKQISKNFAFLEESRRTMRDFPTIKELFTVAIAGFPNVGKSTLLSKLTTSTPEIKPYAFTTKTLNTGYFSFRYQKIQFVDTPGTLNRINKMNDIEKTAYLAMKHCADIFIYVYDITEPYPLAEQKKLLKKLKKFDKPIILYLSKTDILPSEKTSVFLKKNKCEPDLDVLKKKITNEFMKYMKYMKK
ncbi:GTP-binding protein [Candidatus Woesearchaeota archaeon]|jgi:nucleolar GTP-binding protein|nr:GTP-binding protein [Candidatus Woesearchaeota archaeon]|tara:strand:- start:21 stop:998 length:978 start_codon:yes stop_codon:yes gene_type:complete